ncbi:MAG: citrate lyase holo-[acyl-carrier protein] synthase [Clostridia bacterium]|nr:citrate lyase holo-[acyl-carrier protein] synthase [Clostridia bacterium]
MPIVRIGLNDILDARERRVERRRKLLERFNLPLICFTMNIAGEVKNDPLIRLAFQFGLGELKAHQPVYLKTYDEPTGLEAYLVFQTETSRQKEIAEGIEEGLPIGRLFDMDVFSPEGEKVERISPRTCIICGEPAAACARSRAHGLEAVQNKTQKILEDFATDFLANAVVEALKAEVRVTPKPGLVDENNNGAHDDLSMELFDESANCLRPYFSEAVRLGLKETAAPKALLETGRRAEEAMLAVTGGVNTHKGANYSFLLLLFAIGCALRDGQSDPFQTVSEVACAIEKPLGTHGALVFARYGEKGVVGEARCGLPNAKWAGELLKTLPPELVLLHLISKTRDTNVLYRGGMEAQTWLQSEARRIIELRDGTQTKAIVELDRACISRGISPGGCADLLALGLFLDIIRDFTTFL